MAVPGGLAQAWANRGWPQRTDCLVAD